jgi:replicative DNA helicase
MNKPFIHHSDERPAPPYDVDIEQALLGAILGDNALFWRVESLCSSHHFYDPLHQRMWAAIAFLCNSQRIATPLTVKAALADDEGLKTIGELYLINLVRSAPSLPNVRDYAKILRELAVRREMIRISEDLLNAAMTRDLDIKPEEIADEACEALYEAAHAGDQGDGPQDIGDLMLEAAKAGERARNNPDATYISTGIPCVDKALGGLFPCDLTVLGAAPNMGKSGLVAQIGEGAARAGKRTLIFSLEMRPLAMTTRYAAVEAGASSDKILLGRTTDAQMDKLAAAPAKFAGLPLHIDGSRNLSVAQMRARVQALRRRTGKVALVVIDHLRFIRALDPRANEPDQIQQITRDLTTLGQELEVAVLLVAHLNREYNRRQNHRPIISDLYGSSAIEQNADHIWFLHREQYYLEREEPDNSDKKAYDAWSSALEKAKGGAELFNVKRRMGGLGNAKLLFKAPFVQFADPDLVGAAAVAAGPNLFEQLGGANV